MSVTNVWKSNRSNGSRQKLGPLTRAKEWVAEIRQTVTSLRRQIVPQTSLAVIRRWEELAQREKTEILANLGPLARLVGNGLNDHFAPRQTE
jgi:hypothetical protein